MSTATVNGHLDALLGKLQGVKSTGDGKWQCCCPAHDDDRASLSVTETSDGTILVNCHANCATADVVGAVGMKMRDLFPRVDKQCTLKRIVATYDYRDADGKLIFQAVRQDPKGFFQRRRDRNGCWVNSLDGCRKVVYRLPELLDAEPNDVVWVVEGEKDADRLRSLGIVATCNAGGAGKWGSEHAESLRGRKVAVAPDNDNTGRDHAEKVARSLNGIATSVKIVELPGLPAKGDVSDFLNNGGSAGGLWHEYDAAGEWAPTVHKTSRDAKPSTTSTPRHLTDLGNAERFTEQHGADVRYCHQQRKWFQFDGRRWLIDSSGEITRRAKRTARSIYSEAAGASSTDQAEAIAKWATGSERRERLSAMIALAESEQPIPINVSCLDGDAYLLNFLNGTLELKTGELREHRREDFITKCCPIEYPTEAGDDPELWLSTLDRIFSGNRDQIDFLQRLFGVSLIGEVVEHILPILYGVGANGKTLVLQTWAGMLGDYAGRAPHSLLMLSKGDRHPCEIADLHGKRFVAAEESADGGRLSESLVKEIKRTLCAKSVSRWASSLRCGLWITSSLSAITQSWHSILKTRGAYASAITMRGPHATGEGR